MSVEANKAQTRQIIELGWNKGDTDALDRLISADYGNKSTGETRESWKQRVQMIRAAFPDWEMTAEEMLGDGDKVVTRFRVTGTHKGTFNGIAPTGKKIEATGIAIDRVVDGIRVESWVEWDMLGLLRQLGMKLVADSPR